MPQQYTRNLNPSKFFSKVEQESSVIDQLENLANVLEDRAVTTINWYLVRKEWPKNLSRWVRGLAIFLAIAGGLSPLSASAGLVDANRWNQLGYVFIALAGAILLIDRYFGFSTAWMRFMTAQMALQRALEKFQLSWAVWKIQLGGQGNGTAALTSDQVNGAVALLSGFQAEIGTLVDQEFQTWIAEFKEQLANLQAAINKDRDEQRPGNVVVSVTSATPLQGPISLYVDNQLASQTSNLTALLTALPPGSHLITAKASSNGSQLECNQAVTVIAGQTARTDLTLAGQLLQAAPEEALAEAAQPA